MYLQPKKRMLTLLVLTFPNTFTSCLLQLLFTETPIQGELYKSLDFVPLKVTYEK